MKPELQEFYLSKLVRQPESGFAVKREEIHPLLFDWQAEVVIQALKVGKYALFEECGMGKTLQQVEWSRHVFARLSRAKRVLIIAPLAVAHQTIAEGAKIGVSINYVRHQEEAEKEGIYITNYDMLKEFDGSQWGGVVLDESSILKAYTGATKRMILDMFETTPYKLACTATPAPNDHLELGNHAQFLNVMQSNEMIQRWFINDTMSAGSYRLKKHSVKDFWRWVTSWAVCISKPSDLGYSDDGFIIPPLEIHSIMIGVDHTRAQESGQLFISDNISATGMWREKRITLKDRCAAARDLVKDNADPWIVWCDTNDEADELVRLFPEAVEVRGSESIKSKEEKLSAFSSGKEKIIITKPDIAGFGLNWQHCANQIFVGASFSFEKIYQALRRSWRYRQTRTVHANMIYSETETNIVKAFQKKQEAHKNMQRQMNEAMQEYGLGKSRDLRAVKIDIETDHASGKNWDLYLGDSCQEMNRLPDNSVDFAVTSPPFANLYIYSDSVADMGNCADEEEFFGHYAYVIAQTYRVLKPGRLIAVHCKDLPKYMNRDGAAGLIDFPGHIIRAHEEAGFTFHSRVTIWKDPVIEMQRTKNHGLLHKNWTERGEVVRQGMADYLLVFRKFAGIEDVPDKQILHKLSGKDHEFIGDQAPEHFDSDRDYSIQVWQRYASPVWFDINQTRVLNVRQAREGNDEKHICPLQLDVIGRAIDIWSIPDDLVIDPFNGIGSTGVEALRMKRRYAGFELKRSYFNTSISNLKRAAEDVGAERLFDMDEYLGDPEE